MNKPETYPPPSTGEGPGGGVAAVALAATNLTPFVSPSPHSPPVEGGEKIVVQYRLFHRRFLMRRILFWLFSALLLVLALPAVARADTAIEATTIMRFNQTDRPGISKQDQLPLTQFLGVDADGLAD